MMSIQFLTRNLRRVASLRGFSSATVTEKSEIVEKSQNTVKQKQTNKSSRSLDSKHLKCCFIYVIPCSALFHELKFIIGVWF